MDAADLRLALEKLNVVGSVLYVGAHPDDENNAMLAWLSNGRKVRTAYLSLTRGDGGQNLIGPEQGEALGVIRTQELLSARRVDGAEQFFGRSVDFGFSKNADETLRFWGHDRALADVVWVIRRYRPDIIITRFAPDSTAGHGHHWASAILAEEAFSAAADTTRFRDQFRWVRPWQARRLMRNVARFGNAGPDTTRGRLSVDLGAYDALLGRSYTEIAGESRSMHKTQGFGAAERRGAFTNSFERRAGQPATRDLFDGVDLTWARIKGGAPLTALFTRVAREFRPEHPEASLPVLLDAEAILATLPDEPIVVRKREDLRNVIRACAGLWLEATALTPTATSGGRVRVATSVLDRSDVPITIRSIRIATLQGASADAGSDTARTLATNVARNDTFAVVIAAAARTTEPYWLRVRPGPGSFEVGDQLLIGMAETPPALTATFDLAVRGRSIRYTVPVVYRWVDPVLGERYRSFEIVPPASVRLDRGTYLYADARTRPIQVTVQSTGAPVAGDVTLELPAGWSASPQRFAVSLRGGDADTTVTFSVTAGATAASGSVRAWIGTPQGPVGVRLVRLDDPHIPVQTMLPPAEARLVRADVRIAGREAGYLMGAGDPVPEALEQLGYHVTMLGDDDVERTDLARFDVIVAGLRAYNTRPRLRALQRKILDYVNAGGRFVLQYQTPEQGIQDRLGPYPLQFSRDRVTDETAVMTPVRTDHPLLTTPNRITASDFDGWVQERGVWYARPADSRYERVLTAHDPNEKDLDGGLLYAPYGRGTFVFTALAFFRQLPAGVPGAWRLFANLVSPASAARGTVTP